VSSGIPVTSRHRINSEALSGQNIPQNHPCCAPFETSASLDIKDNMTCTWRPDRPGCTWLVLVINNGRTHRSEAATSHRLRLMRSYWAFMSKFAKVMQ
jgi:hypothetical protein